LPVADGADSARVRVLVLTSGTGSGHDMRARAFQTWAQEAYGERVEVRIEQLIENASLLGRFGVWLYNTIQRYAPFLHHIYWPIVELFTAAHSQRVTYGGGYYRRLLRDYRPHVVFSVHDSLNRGYFEDARRVLGAANVRCGTYCGEWSGGYGFSRNWVNPSADFYVARNHDSLQEALRLGMPAERCSVFTNFLPPRDFGKRMDAAAIRAFRQTELGLDPGRFTVLLSTGALGANNHFRFLDSLLGLGDRVQVVAVCGRDRRTYERLRQWDRDHPELHLYAECFSERMHLLIQAADAVVTRGGANTAAEALYFGRPLLFNPFGGIMPQEYCTVRYFTAKGAGVLLRDRTHFRDVVELWSARGPAFQGVMSCLDALREGDHPDALLRAVMGAATHERLANPCAPKAR